MADKNNELTAKHNKKVKNMQHWGNGHDGLLVKCRKLIDDHEKLIKLNDMHEDLQHMCACPQEKQRV